VHYSFVDEVMILFLLKESYLDVVDVKNIAQFIKQFVSYVKSVYASTYAMIEKTQDVSDDCFAEMHTIAKEFSKLFVVEEQ
jgi:F0F1-type ATP synthase alpha subunit